METNIYSLLNKPGSNLPLLFEIIAGERENMWDNTLDSTVAATSED